MLILRLTNAVWSNSCGLPKQNRPLLQLGVGLNQGSLRYFNCEKTPSQQSDPRRVRKESGQEKIPLYDYGKRRGISQEYGKNETRARKRLEEVKMPPYPLPLPLKGKDYTAQHKYVFYSLILYAARMASASEIVDSNGKRNNAYGNVTLLIPKSPNLAMSAAYVKGLASAIALITSGMISSG